MPQNTAPPVVSPWSWQAEEASGIRIPYQVIRHAVSKSGPVRIQGVELTRVGDVVRGARRQHAGTSPAPVPRSAADRRGPPAHCDRADSFRQAGGSRNAGATPTQTAGGANRHKR